MQNEWTQKKATLLIGFMFCCFISWIKQRSSCLDYSILNSTDLALRGLFIDVVSYTEFIGLRSVEYRDDHKKLWIAGIEENLAVVCCKVPSTPEEMMKGSSLCSYWLFWQRFSLLWSVSRWSQDSRLPRNRPRSATSKSLLTHHL